ncbi:MAG TPA: hypothetical protein VFO16_02580 [Pseudonocardiaceae bacterium]|nr:hypothetical protein [Pseudonocardiaceae bacterium]
MPPASDRAARHRLVCDALGDEVRHAVRAAGPDAFDGTASIQHRAAAALYLLLLDHPVDRQGRCRSCRRPGAMITFRSRRCRILVMASYWLLCQSGGARPRSLLAPDLAGDTTSGAPAGSRAEPAQTPAGRRSSLPPPCAPGGQPDPNHRHESSRPGPVRSARRCDGEYPHWPRPVGALADVPGR